VLCVVPSHIGDREKHFFEILPEILRAQKSVTKLVPVQGAFVPVIKMVFYNIDIDLLFASID